MQRDIPFNLGDPLNGIFFLDSQNGWTFGNVNYRTTDGGTTWTELPFLGSTYFMEFYTSTFGFASGNFGLQVSHNGGLSWEVSPNDMFRFDFEDDLTGLGVSESGIYRTTDGGGAFSLVLSGDADAVAFLTSTVVVGIVDGSFVRSTDNGVTWTSGSAVDGRSHLLAVSADVVLAWGRAGEYPDYDDRVFRSSDGGQSWTDLGEIMDPGPFGASFAFAVPDEETVVASDGAGSMFHSADAGQTWIEAFASRGSQQSFLSSATPVFADTQTGYFGYGPGFVIKTTDGGASWTQISSGSGESLNDVDRFPSGELIAVGENGTVLTNSGTTPWIVNEALTTDHLAAVHVIGPQEVVVVDETGRVFRSADTGLTWTAATTTPGLEAEDLYFTTLLDGWVTGFGSSGVSLYHTVDGGDSWIPASGPLGAYYAVDFEGVNGWAANVSGRYYRTTDGGDTWIQGDLPTSPLQIQDMDFYDENLGYVVGWYGYAARSEDGGVTWTELPTPNNTDKFTDIYLIGPNEFWLSTHENQAYYTATGGQNWAVLDIESNGFGNFSAIAATPEGDAWAVGWQGYIEHFAGPPPSPANRPPEASFEFVAAGLTVSFTDTSTDPDGFIVSWAWDFGDGETSTEQNPTHTFPEADTYIVELIVTDDDGDTGGTVRFIAVQPGPGGTFGEFTEVTPLDSLWVTPQDEDFWIATTAAADYDSDGDLDIAVLGYYVVYNTSVEEMLVLLKNNGEAGPDEWDFDYVDVPIGDLSTGASDLAWGDVDGDGDQDLVVGSGGATLLYRNDDGTLVATDTELPGYYEDNDQADFDLRSITWADYDNDGDQDLLIPSVFDFEESLYRTALMRNDGANGTGGWIFTEVSVGIDPTSHAQSAWADFDGDQDLDLLLVNLAPLMDQGFIRLYRNDGGTFVGEDILGTLTIEHGEADWGDYDADGDLDILVVGHIRETDGSFDRVLRIYRNDANVFTPLDIIDCIPCEGWFDLTAGTWGDYDSDGDMDILMTGTYNSGFQIEGRARIYSNDGGVFTSTEDDLPAPRASGTRGGTFSWLDIDGEGDLDYFIAGEYWVPGGNGLVEAQMHLYRNDVAGTNVAPTTPPGLIATVGDPDPQTGQRVVELSWVAATDDSTPASALTYDLALRLNGQPIADPRRLPEPGTLSAVTDWALTGLEDGEYVWAVCAVDSAFNGGPFAQGSFNIGVTTANGPEALPRVYSFDGTYPNPFSSSTTIRYGLPESASVDVAVYDILGRLVTKLVQDERPAGFHEVEWDASALASGTYLVRFSSESYTKTRRVMLLR